MIKATMVPRGQLFEGVAAPMTSEPGTIGLSLPQETGSGEERVAELVSGGGVRVERIVSFGQSSPEGFWYDQDEDEFVVLLSGAAELEFEGGEIVKLGPGEWVDIRAHFRHRVKWTAPYEPSVWLVLFRPAS